ncbi:MAG TPA: VCBS repeat-containing protein [Thermoanaerobaculia bacterium]|nr:VCBS repeat-containing protein [Thermoanaerobaculia bacterium]
MPLRLALATLLAVPSCFSGTTTDLGSAPPAFTHRLDLEVGGEPSAVVAADVTGDGHADLLVADERGGRVVVFIGDGAGGFERHADVPAGPHPSDLAVGDLDGDGRPDLAIANHETDHLTLLAGDGSGGFRPFAASPLAIDVAPHPHAVALADVDEDGALDLLVDHRDGHGLLLLLGDGTGGFTASQVIGVGGDPYRGMVLADLDDDGHLDLATPNERAVAVRLGDGGGGFRTPAGSPLAAGDPFTVAAGDFDGDGRSDLGAGSGEGRGEVHLWLGDGAGGFAAAPGSPFATAAGPKRAVAADLDGDGRDELLLTVWGGPLLVVRLGDDGARVEEIAAGADPWGLATADLDGDGRPDVAVANAGDGTLTVLLSRR